MFDRLDELQESTQCLQERPDQVRQATEASILQRQTGSGYLLQRNHQGGPKQGQAKAQHHYANQRLLRYQQPEAVQTGNPDTQAFWLCGGCSV